MAEIIVGPITQVWWWSIPDGDETVPPTPPVRLDEVEEETNQ